VTEVTSGAVLITSDGPNSLVDLTLLETFNGNLFTTASGFRATNTGVILTPALTSISSGEITADAPTSIDLSLVTSITGDGKITLTGGVHDLTSLVTMKGSLYVSGPDVPVMTMLSDIDGASLYVSNGAVLNLPLVTSYLQDDNNRNYFRADGAASQLNLPNLTGITSGNSSTRRLFFEAWNGGQINLPSVNLINNPTTNASLLQFSADGADSRIDLSSVTTIDPSDAQFFETNGGVIFTPGLDSSNLPDLEVLALSSSLTSVTPGTIVSLTWTVQNSGGVDFNGTRRDSIFLSSNPEGTDAIRLANFNINSLLIPTASESITHEVTIPANQASTSTILTLADNAQPDGTEDLEIIASATGYASGSASLTISDETLPELLISRLDAIPEVNTNETGTFSYRISNLGGQTTSNPIEIQPLAPFSDYQGWVNAYMIPAGQQGQSTESPGAGIPNLLSYGLGIDPIGGISPAQAEPGPVVLISPTTSELCFQLPNGGRPDLRYLVQTTTDLVTWDTIGIKEGTLPWSEGSVITEENVSPNLSIIKVAHDKGLDDDDQRFMRLIVQIIE
jgi:hypothetical protein